MRLKQAAWFLGGAVVAMVFASVLIVQSPWFHSKVRDGIVAEIERATGARVEAAAFHFDWHTLRAELDGLVLHGTEPAGKPPLLRAQSVAVGLKVISIFKRDVDIQYLDVHAPQIYLTISPDGSTNLPRPKAPSPTGTMQRIFQLAIGQFRASNGVLQVENRMRTPFDIEGRNLAAQLLLDPHGPSYQGGFAASPLNISGVSTDVQAQVSIETNRLSVTSASIKTADSSLNFSGSLDNFASPTASVRYTAHIPLDEAARALKRKLPVSGGTLEASGTGTWSGDAPYTIAAEWRIPRTTAARIGAIRAEGQANISSAGVFFSAVRIHASKPTPLEARIARVDLHGRGLDARGVDVAALGGSYRGEARVADFDRFTVSGEIAGIDARRAIALYSTEALPWDGIVSGKVTAEGSLTRSADWRAAVDVTAAGPQVHGAVAANYDARTGAVEIDRGSLVLPSSRAELSGGLGKTMRVHVDTHDLADLLPILGKSAASVPLQFHNGSISFDGTATGSLKDLHAAGRLTAANFTYEGRSFDSLSSSVTASPANVQLTDAVLKRGALQAQFHFAVNLDNWKPEESSFIDGAGTVRNASAPELVALAGLGPQPVTGTVSATGSINGTVANPLLSADVAVAKGSFHEEPFDQITARVRATRNRVQVLSSQTVAGSKQIRAQGTYDRGRLQFEMATNAMPVEQIVAVSRARPGVKGVVQVTAQGAVDVKPFRIESLDADLTAHGLQLTGQPLGNLHLEAKSQNGALRAHLDSDFADSAIQGNGEWQLTGDYPGSATITFSKLDFGDLRAWLYPSLAGTQTAFQGFAEGQLHIDAALLKPESARGELRLPKLQIGASAQPASITLTNSGPIVTTFAGSVLTVSSARLVGHDTDLNITGKAALSGKQALDLRVNGRVDLALVHELNRDFTASGELTADAAIRGTLDAPQTTGRVSFEKAAFYVADLPNGITNANGVISFAGDRATIQSFTGETGGGHITVTGFAGYDGGGPVIFRLHARLDQVRVRYPEGVSTVADANLTLTGTSDRSMLAGTISVLRTGFNPQADFSSLVAASAQPVRTPSARSGFLGGLNFDVQIQTAPDIQFESALTQDVQVEANLRLRGTATNPALLGRINVTEGVITFFGTKYHIAQGSIAFYNPLRIDPVLDIDLDTKARGIDVTLTVSGPLNKLSLTPRSDPPLQFNEIVALLATGRTPTNDPALLAQQTTSPQSWQQMGASALLGQAIASPVAGRLQRFFGVSNLRIDPTLPGVEYNPQARLTLEQQITPEITFTYITDVTSSNPEVVRVEWAFAKLWSVVALREENGMFGIDFFYKRRF